MVNRQQWLAIRWRPDTELAPGTRHGRRVPLLLSSVFGSRWPDKTLLKSSGTSCRFLPIPAGKLKSGRRE